MLQKVIQMKNLLNCSQTNRDKKRDFLLFQEFDRNLQTEKVAVCAAADEVNCLKLPDIKHSIR